MINEKVPRINANTLSGHFLSGEGRFAQILRLFQWSTTNPIYVTKTDNHKARELHLI
jgi:hypothetical protein